MTDYRLTIRRDRIEPAIFAGIIASLFAAIAGFGGMVYVSSILLAVAVTFIGMPILFIRAGRVR